MLAEHLWWLFGVLLCLHCVLWLSSALFVISATGRLQIRESGIWLYDRLVPWDRIRSSRCDGSTLSLELTGFPPKASLSVPSDHRQAFDALWAKHYSVESVAG